MNWSVDDIYKFLKYLVRKNQAGSVSVTDFFYTWNSEQLSYFNDEIGRWQNRNNGKTAANTGLVLNETILSDLAPFTITELLTIITGTITKPDDFEYRIAARKGGFKITFINPGQVAEINKSVIDPPSITDNCYYATEYQNYCQLFPNSVTGSIDFDYVASPTEIIWGYYFDYRGSQIYNPATSVQPKWANTTIITITKRALNTMGVSYKDADFSNFGKESIATGE